MIVKKSRPPTSLSLSCCVARFSLSLPPSPSRGAYIEGTTKRQGVAAQNVERGERDKERMEGEKRGRGEGEMDGWDGEWEVRCLVDFGSTLAGLPRPTLCQCGEEEEKDAQRVVVTGQRRAGGERKTTQTSLFSPLISLTLA